MSDKEVSDKMQEIMNRIKTRSEDLSMSYQTLSDKVGISKSTLQRYETGFIKNMPIDKIEDIAKALCTTPAYLMGWTSNPNISSLKGKITPISAIKCDTDDEKKLLLSYRTLSAPSKKKVLSYCNGLADIEKADFELNAAHALPNATTEDKLHDEDIMNDDDF